MLPELTLLAEASRRYGADPQYIFGGGGNTSWKDAAALYIKPSGVSLATIQPDQFVKMERAAIRRLFAIAPPSDPGVREAQVKELMLAAVAKDSRGRPSVEAPVHEVIPQRYIIHTHSVLLNGLTCAANGAAACRRLFPAALWIEYVDPGYTLSTVVKARVEQYQRDHGTPPDTIFLQSHGVFVAGDTVDAIHARYDALLAAVRAAYAAAGVATTLTVGAPAPAALRDLAPALRSWLGGERARAAVSAAGDFAVATGPLTPDHIVYGRSFPFIGAPDAAALAAFKTQRGYQPIILRVPGQAVFTAEVSLKSARLAMESAQNAALVQQLTAAFGGPRYFSDRERGFIESWEVESYRRNLMAAGSAGAGRLTGKIALVTGGAQGFGLGIAQGLLQEGATVVLADINRAGAEAAARDLAAQHGAGRAFALAANVADEASLAAMRDELLALCGGLDLLIANAGVLRAGPVSELSKADWDFVTNVNYTGYFLCVKTLAPVLARQTAAGGVACDIIQINSKSGLVGSNRNAAYAGSKFGGIGLTQSFALELVEQRIKVNSICPGNYFDGPLWMDPERGLFVQYLRSGKVPGAKTVADVKRAYEEKVPMRRGCLPEDVVRGIVYLVEQQYETGQALPITGGQVMLA